MRRPSFQFYPADWLGNANLRRCSHTEKGIWLDVLCLMHDAPEYGVLRWPLADIARAVGCQVGDLEDLITKNVLKGSDGFLEAGFIYIPRSGRKNGPPVELIAPQQGPLWYSSRMVRDEHVRQHRGEGSRFGEAPELTPKAAPIPTFGESTDSPKPPFGDGSTSSSSSSISKPICSPSASGSAGDEFSVFWNLYPRKVAKAEAEKAWKRLNPSKPLLADLLEGLERQKALPDWTRDGGKFIPYPATWLNGRRWEDEAPLAAEATALPACLEGML